MVADFVFFELLCGVGLFFSNRSVLFGREIGWPVKYQTEGVV